MSRTVLAERTLVSFLLSFHPFDPFVSVACIALGSFFLFVLVRFAYSVPDEPAACALAAFPLLFFASRN